MKKISSVLYYGVPGKLEHFYEQELLSANLLIALPPTLKSVHHCKSRLGRHSRRRQKKELINNANSLIMNTHYIYKEWLYEWPPHSLFDIPWR